MKQTQRDALTAEKQSIRRTGGGPMEPPPAIDPDVSVIVPNLMTTAPVLYSSNMDDSEINSEL